MIRDGKVDQAGAAKGSSAQADILKHFTRETRQDCVTDAGTIYRLKNHLLHVVKTHTTVRGVKENRESSCY